MANATLRYQEELEVGKNSLEDRESDWFVMGTFFDFNHIFN
ncbi:hypothetical protein [Dolichospermum sp. UHCC 0352]|nr:hypothetical protein [Dolichospermum sp. UHCC 0352]